MTEVIATEAVKVLTPGLAGAASAAARRVLRLLRGRSARPPADRDGLLAYLLRLSREDETFAAQLAQELVAVESVDAVAAVAPALFKDRDELRARLSAPGVWLVAGARGAGKTALARQVGFDLVTGDRAHARAHVDLDDYRTGAALRIVEVQQEVLRQLNVEVIDEGPAAVADQYLRALVFRRFVLVLDNVAGAAEAERLAHPWPCAVVLATTRMLDSDLRAWCPTDPVVLFGLDDTGAHELLAAKCGAAMTAAEPGAVAELIRLCDAIPSTLLQSAARLVRRRGEPGAVASLVRRLGAEPDTAAVIDASVRDGIAELSAGTAGDLALLAGHPGTDFTVESAAALLGHSAHGTVDELLDAGLIVRTGERLRLLWAVRRQAPAPDTDRNDAFITWFRDLAGAADLAMDPAGVTDRARDGRLRRYPAPPVLPWPLPERRPVDWLQAEAHNVLDVLREAYGRGRHVEVVQICGALEALLTHRGHHWLCVEANRWGSASASALGWTAAVARLHALQGRIHTLVGLLDEAQAELDTAGKLLAGLGDRQLESSLLEFRSRLAQERGDPVAAEPEMRRAVAIDHEIGDRRAAGLHHRMLANLLAEAGRGREALALLDGGSVPAGDDRNAGRLHLVRAKAHAAEGDATAAGDELRLARDGFRRSGAQLYEDELTDVEARVARLAGDVEAARARWGWLADRYILAGHRRSAYYIDQLNILPPVLSRPGPESGSPRRSRQ
jgi:hypothetical protein